MSKVMVMCDCSAADKCPQGKVGSMNRCSIVRDERVEATIERPPSSPKPTFDLGKSYRAVNKAVMRIVEVHADGGFRARQVKDGNGDKDVATVVYNIRGVTIQPGWSDYNLFYGAVEDGLNAASRERKEMLDRLSLTDLRQLHSRLNRQGERIDAIRNALQGTDHEGENVKRRLDALEAARPYDTAILMLEERMDKLVLENALRLAEHTGRIEALERTRKAFTSLLDALRPANDNQRG